MKKFEMTDHEPSFLPEGNWKLAFADEFDGNALDTSKWDYRLSMMGKMHQAWVPDGVTLDGKSNAVFSVMLRDGKPVSSQLQTGYNFMDEPVKNTKFGEWAIQWNIGKLHEAKYTHSYGYYECRCRLQQKEGWWSAFWIQSPTIGASLDCKRTGSEIDIMESFKPGKVVPHHVITNGYGLDIKDAFAGENVQLDEKEFHRFGMLWDDTGYTFYIDGKESGKVTEYVSGCPEFILISTEVDGYRHQNHEPTQEAYDAVGDTFLVDYVRVFDKIV